jgi:hypothetical protein
VTAQPNRRPMPAFSIKYQSRAKPVDMLGQGAFGEMTPVRLGGDGFWWCVCSKAHQELHKGSILRRAKKLGEPSRCRQCREERAKCASNVL